jgi:glycerol-3-phosphate dehydrogenase
VPTYGWGIRGKLPLRAAFMLLEMVTRDRNRGIADPRQHVPTPYLLSRKEILDRVPELEPRGLTGAGVFYDGQIVDPVRLVYAVVRSAQQAGAVAANYCSATTLHARNGKVEGLAVTDEVSGRRSSPTSRDLLRRG